MSYLTFQTRHDEIRLTGVEVRNIAAQAINALTQELAHDYGPVRRALRLDGPDLRLRVEYLSGGNIIEIPTGVSQHPVIRADLFSLALDTWVAHRPEARILVWLFQNSIRHGWIDGPDRTAFADRLQQTLDAGLARRGMADATGDVHIGGIVLPGCDRVGLEEVISWLRADDDPVVTSLSLGESFPNRYVVLDAGVWHPDAAEDDDHDGQDEDDPWDRLDHGTQWDLCLRALAKLRPSRRWRTDDETWWSPFSLARLDGALRQAERYTATAGAGLT